MVLLLLYSYSIKEVYMSKERREELLSLRITRTELYFISRQAKALNMSRPNLIIEAVKKYVKDNEQN
jgi:hypothetical protein